MEAPIDREGRIKEPRRWVMYRRPNRVLLCTTVSINGEQREGPGTVYPSKCIPNLNIATMRLEWRVSMAPCILCDDDPHTATAVMVAL